MPPARASWNAPRDVSRSSGLDPERAPGRPGTVKRPSEYYPKPRADPWRIGAERAHDRSERRRHWSRRRRLPGCDLVREAGRLSTHEPEASAGRGPGRSAQLDEKLREPVVRLGQPLLHAAADHPVAIFLRGRDRPDREQGPTLVLGEGRGLDEDVPGHRLVLESLDDPLRRDDLAVLAAEPARRPVWRAVAA